MTEAEFDLVQEVHVKGAYSCSKAAWPIMRKQKYGRVIMVSRCPFDFLPSLFLPHFTHGNLYKIDWISSRKFWFFWYVTSKF